MAKNKNVTLLKNGNRIVVDPANKADKDEIRAALSPVLTYKSKRYLVGYEAKKAGRRFEETFNQVFILDHRDRIVTAFGMHARVYDKLTQMGYRVKYKDLAPHPNPEVFKPYWERLFDPSRGIELRPGQDEALIKVLSNQCGRLDCPPGWGKSFLISMIGLLLPKARIDVITKRVDVLQQRIFPDLRLNLPSVGIICSKQKVYDRRIMCISAGSIHRADGKADIVICDECPEIAADSYAEKMAVYDNARMFGVSATHDMRLDNKDMRVEAMFGPILYEMSYEEAKQHGMVVPIEVHWTDVAMDFNPAGESDDSVDRKRYGIWQNQHRNELIAADARKHDDDTQVLITCETISHMLHLKKLLPDFEVVYAEKGLDPIRRRRYVRDGLIPSDFPHMTRERRDKLTRDFETGKLKKAICNQVWNVGVDFRNLSVLVRADAGGSPTNDVQIPGRASRVIDGKTHSIIHDYRDQFDVGFSRKADNRKRMYDKQGWKQIVPTKKKQPRHIVADDLGD